MPSAVSDISPLLVVRAQSGDRDALDRLLAALQGPLFRHVLGILGDEDQAKDVLQDALWLVCRKLGWLRDPRWVRAWAYRIATREAVRRARRERRRIDALAPDDALDQVAEPEADPSPDEDLVAALPALLDAVSPASAVVLRMHYLDGLTHAECAEALEIPEGTVKSRLGYGLAQLRRRLAVEAGGHRGQTRGDRGQTRV